MLSYQSAICRTNRKYTIQGNSFTKSLVIEVTVIVHSCCEKYHKKSEHGHH